MTREEAIAIFRGFKFLPREMEAVDMAIKALEKEHALDKIRAETMKFQTYKMFEGEDTVYVDRDDVLAIIDKYKAESEGKE